MLSVENYYGKKEDNLNRVLKEFEKTSKDLNQDVEIIKTWLRTQHHLPEMSCDELIINMLIKSKFSIEKCKNTLDMYYSLRTIIPDLYKNKNPKLANMQYLIDTNACYPLPTMTEDGYRVIINRVNHDPDTTNPYDVIAHRFAIGEINFLEDFVVGNIYIEDLSNINFGHVTKFTPAVLKKATTLFEKTYNVRMKGWHFINVPSYTETAMTLLKQLLSPKLAQRIHIHQSPETILEFIPSKILPVEYGGTDFTMNDLRDVWKKMFAKHQDRFDVLEKLKTDESKRPAALNNDELLGYYGNFKKINVD